MWGVWANFINEQLEFEQKVRVLRETCDTKEFNKIKMENIFAVLKNCSLELQ